MGDPERNRAVGVSGVASPGLIRVRFLNGPVNAKAFGQSGTVG